MSGFRLLDTSTKRVVVVDPSSARAWSGEGGKIRAADELDGPVRSGALFAVSEIEQLFLGPVPGAATPGGEFVVAGAASPRELKILTDGGSIEVGRSKLAQHLDFFDSNRDGVLTIGEVFRGFRRLGFRIVPSAVKAAATVVLFGGLKNRFRIDIDEIGANRIRSSTGVYDSEGDIDVGKRAELLSEFEHRGGALSEQDLRSILQKRNIGFVSKSQFGSLMSVCARINGTRTITAEQFSDLFEGTLLWQAASLTDDSGRRGR